MSIFALFIYNSLVKTTTLHILQYFSLLETVLSPFLNYLRIFINQLSFIFYHVLKLINLNKIVCTIDLYSLWYFQINRQISSSFLSPLMSSKRFSYLLYLSSRRQIQQALFDGQYVLQPKGWHFRQLANRNRLSSARLDSQNTVLASCIPFCWKILVIYRFFS